MDTIKFVIGTPYETHLAAKGVEVELFFNDKPVPHSILNVPQIVAAHKFKFAEFDLYTCSCGVPGCAGFHTQVIQTKVGSTTLWTFPETGEYKTEKMVYEFETSDFSAQFEKLMADLLKLEEDGIYNSVLIPQDYGDEYSKTETPQSIEESFDWYENRYQAEQNQRDMLEANFPEMMDKKFIFTYDGVNGKYPYQFNTLIGKIINQFPSEAHEPFYLAKCKLVVKAIQAALQGDNALFYKITTNAYVKRGGTAFWLVDWDFDDVTEENFDLNKMGISQKD